MYHVSCRLRQSRFIYIALDTLFLFGTGRASKDEEVDAVTISSGVKVEKGQVLVVSTTSRVYNKYLLWVKYNLDSQPQSIILCIKRYGSSLNSNKIYKTSSLRKGFKSINIYGNDSFTGKAKKNFQRKSIHDSSEEDPICASCHIIFILKFTYCIYKCFCSQVNFKSSSWVVKCFN